MRIPARRVFARGVVVAAALGLACPAAATTVFRDEVPDPIAKGATCEVSSVGSYGSYIYQWPSKYDQVFWPLVADAGQWYCPTSGFIAFIGDFDSLTDEEAARIRDYLAGTGHRPGDEPTLAQRLERLEAIYALRGTSNEFDLRLLRVIANLQENGVRDTDAAKRYRQRALDAMAAALAREDLAANLRLEYLFVSAGYSRWLGDAEAATALEARLARELDRHAEGELANYATYLAELVPDLARIDPSKPYLSFESE